MYSFFFGCKGNTIWGKNKINNAFLNKYNLKKVIKSRLEVKIP